MTKNTVLFFNLEKIKNICEEYGNGNISMSELGKKYGIPREKVRTLFAKAIIFGYIDIELATKMKNVAIKNNLEACLRNHVKPDDKIDFYYENLINASIRRAKAAEKIDYIRFTLDVYDDNFITDDDYPYSKEDLLAELQHCKEIIIEAERLT